MKWQTIVLIVVLVVVLLFAGYIIYENVKDSCRCAAYSRPRPCVQGEEPVVGESMRNNWYCKNTCSGPSSCEVV